MVDGTRREMKMKSGDGGGGNGAAAGGGKRLKNERIGEGEEVRVS